jgi:16S rRNA processing protein RimM
MPGEGYALSFPGDEGSGPPEGSELRFLIIGRIVGPSGLHGAIKAEVMTDFPDRFRQLETVYLGDDFAPHRLLSSDLRKNGRQVILRFEGFTSREQAERLHGKWIWIAAEEAMPLSEGVYYIHQVLGLNVETEAGEQLGVLTEVLCPGANDVYVVTDGEREVLLPALEEVIRQVDLAARKMVVRLPDGLVE